jgi:hypothetical protein
MPRPPVHSKLLNRSNAAMLAAIEIFNKPKFEYREEAFAILSINAWELLLKAKIVADSPKGERAIYDAKPRERNGRTSQKQYIERTASGLPRTIPLKVAVQRLQAKCLPAEVAVNLSAMRELRDSVIHAHVLSPLLGQKVLEIGTACVRNYVVLAQRWFGLDLREWKLSLMPIGFIDVPLVATGVTISPAEKLILEHLSGAVGTEILSPDKDCHVAVRLQVEIARGSGTGAISVVQTKDPNALKITMTDEEFRTKFPWSYGDLVERCKDRYVGFKLDARFHQIRKTIVERQTLSKIRYLNPQRLTSAKQVFYAPAILGEFDKHYSRKQSSP